MTEVERKLFAIALGVDKKDPDEPDTVAMTRVLKDARENFLTKEYVSDLLYQVLELCPTDYFQLTPQGDWCIDPQSFAVLPQRIRRLIQGVEFKRISGFQYMTVQFMSKDKALALAAKYTLIQRHEVKAVPWELATEPYVETDEEVERRLSSGLPEASGPVLRESGTMAEGDFLQQTEADNPERV